MERFGLNAARLVLAAGAVIGAVALLLAGTGYGFRTWIAVAGLLLVVVGVLTNRVWVAAVPVLLAVGWLVVIALGSGLSGETPWSHWAVIALVAAAGFALCLLAGVALRRGARRATGQRSGFSPQNDAM